LLADDVVTEDRRRVVNAGVQHGRDDQMANMRALAEVEADIAVSVIATRGQRLVLTRVCSSNHDLHHGAFDVELLAVAEIDAESRIAATISFDPDDIDAAFAELDARYLVGEAAAQAHTWSLVAGACAAMNRHEHPQTTSDWVSIDHRRGLAIALGDMTEYIRAVVDITPDFSHYIQAVHRLTDHGAVASYWARGTSQEGFDAEWRVINVLMFEGNLINRLELFDEANVDAALARFDELNRPAPA
jgi:hypothetical protein